MVDRLPRADQGRTTAAERAFPGREPNASARNVRVGVKALFSVASRVLLIEEERADGSTFWTLPGGGVEPGESLTEGLCRELGEELRCSARISEEVGRCRYRHTSAPDTVTYYTVFSGELLTRPDANPSERVLRCRWVDPDDLPEGTLDPFRRMVRAH